MGVAALVQADAHATTACMTLLPPARARNLSSCQHCRLRAAIGVHPKHQRQVGLARAAAMAATCALGSRAALSPRGMGGTRPQHAGAGGGRRGGHGFAAPIATCRPYPRPWSPAAPRRVRATASVSARVAGAGIEHEPVCELVRWRAGSGSGGWSGTGEVAAPTPHPATRAPHHHR